MRKAQEALKLALEALEETRNGLAWFYDSYPQDVTEKGNALLPHVETVLTAIREALAEDSSGTEQPSNHYDDVRESMRQAFEQPAQQQEPEYKGWYCAHCQRGVDSSEVTNHEQHTVCGRVITDDVPPKAQRQEPVAWRWENGGEDKWLNKYIYLDNGGPDCPEDCEPLYTSPPASKPWVGLEPQDFDGVIKSDAFEAGAYWANNILREKNA